jgi:hypothetical protein
MNPFITFREKDKDGNLQYYVLQRAFPHYIGVVLNNPGSGLIGQSAIPGYTLWVVFDGTLMGNMIPNYRNVANEIQTVLDNMAAWYWSDRIILNEKKYSKFKILSYVTGSKH